MSRTEYIIHIEVSLRAIKEVLFITSKPSKLRAFRIDHATANGTMEPNPQMSLRDYINSSLPHVQRQFLNTLSESWGWKTIEMLDDCIESVYMGTKEVTERKGFFQNLKEDFSPKDWVFAMYETYQAPSLLRSNK